MKQDVNTLPQQCVSAIIAPVSCLYGNFQTFFVFFEFIFKKPSSSENPRRNRIRHGGMGFEKYFQITLKFPKSLT